MKYKYGMKYTNYSPKDAPLYGLVDRRKDKTGTYYDILFYDRRLTPDEEKRYGLENVEP